MKTIRKYTLGMLALVSLVGCKDKMMELNTNPGTIGTTNPEYMFLGATNGWNYFGRDWAPAQNSIFHMMQYSARADFGSQPYILEGGVGGGGGLTQYWGGYYGYGNKLTSLVEYIDKSITNETQKAAYQEVRSISELLKTYYAWSIFDTYGAIVYSQAFQAQSGLIKPKYDLIQDKYKFMDSVIKAQVDYLVQPAAPGIISLGQYDGFYGYTYTVNPVGGATYAIQSKADVQRKRWMKFGNAVRLKMAMRFRAQDQAHFDKVLAEVLAVPDGLMTSIEDGCEYIHKDMGYDDVDGVQYGQYSHPTLAFINAMKITNDPRMPMYARPSNNASTMSKEYAFIATHFPDSINQYGSLLQEDNAWVGITANPNNKTIGAFGPGVIVTRPTISFKIKNTSFVEAEPGKHPMISPKTGEPIFWSKDTTITWRFASAVASRLWHKNSGNSSDPQYTARDEHEKPFIDEELIRITTNVLSYSEQCFSLALVAAQGSGSVAGKTTQEWYEIGVRAAIEKAQMDARRVYVRIMTYDGFPLIKGVNGTTEEDKHLYAATPEMIDAYIAHPLVALPAATGEEAIHAIANQIWLSMYTDPQNAWGYWKLTGYPNATAFPAGKNTLPAWGDVPAQPNAIIFEQPMEGSTKMMWSRRLQVPTPNNQNMSNYFEIRDKLLDQPNPDFGVWEANTGRIWWDLTPLK